MKVVEEISNDELKKMSERMYGGIVKADVDLKKKIMIVDMDMHYDGEAYLLEQGSRQQDLWGINLHPDKHGTEAFVEFDSMINIRPSQGNPSRNIKAEDVRQQITALVEEIVHV